MKSALIDVLAHIYLVQIFFSNENGLKLPGVVHLTIKLVILIRNKNATKYERKQNNYC